MSYADISPVGRRKLAQVDFEAYLKTLSAADSKVLRGQKYFRGRPEKDWPKAIETVQKSKEMALEAIEKLDSGQSLTVLEFGGTEKAIENFVTIVTETLPEWWRYANRIDRIAINYYRNLRNLIHEPYNVNYDDVIGFLYELPHIINGLDFEILVPLSDC